MSSFLSPNNYVINCSSMVCAGSHPAGSTEIGPNSSATGLDSIAIGKDTVASGTGSLAVQPNAEASGLYSTAIGVFAKATDDYDISIGNTAGNTNTAATGVVSLAGIPVPAVAAAKASTHQVPITINGVVYNFLVSNI